MNEINLYDVVKKTKMCVMSGVDFGKIVFQGVKSKKSDFFAGPKSKIGFIHYMGNYILNILSKFDDVWTYIS